MIYGISNINYNNYNNRYRKPVFKAHPDFYRLIKNYDVTASSYFRRGIAYGSPNSGFADVAAVLSDVFSRNINISKKMFIAGIADSQEPFSYLAVIKDSLKKNPLDNNLDLYTVDIQSKPSDKKLFNDSFFDVPSEPEFAKSSFVKEEVVQNRLFPRNKYRVKDEIYNYLQKTYNNPKKALWETRIQDAVKVFPDDSFDIVSVNNTFMYLPSHTELQDTLNNVLRILKKGGYFITDPYKYDFFKRSKIFGSLEEINYGIYKK